MSESGIPVRFGPMRSCIKALTRRSAYTVYETSGRMIKKITPMIFAKEVKINTQSMEASVKAAGRN